VYGCLIAGAIGDALGAPVETLYYREIREKYGKLTEFIPSHRGNTGNRYLASRGEPGVPGAVTDDSTLRHYLSLAIAQKGGRVTPDDFGRVWIEKLNPNRFWRNERLVLEKLRIGMNPWDTGKGTPPTGCAVMGIAPVGIVNAGNPAQAYQDGFNIAFVNQDDVHRDAAATVAAGIAAAFVPGATVESVLDAMLRHSSFVVRRAIALSLDLAYASDSVDGYAERFYATMLDWTWPQAPDKGEWDKHHFFSGTSIELVQASFTRFSITGLRTGSAGTGNYTQVLHHRDLVTVLTNTVVWVVAVLVLTVLISLALAQFLSKDFWGRPIVRWAIIVPWAASLVITARLFTLIYDYYHGILNQVLLWLHVISKPIDFLGDDRWTMFSMVLVGVFVSIPFTAYVFLAGLHAIPQDVYEAARVDGARPWQIYSRITLPLLRPAILVASVLNIIYVFNSFPIVYTLNDRNPGFAHDTSITFMYKLAFKSAEHDVGMAAAAGVANVLLILVVVTVYLRLVNWQKETA
jgi:ABC-type sugar transport system permease subunit/ADP-ribosylglycohydrolase